MQRPAPRFAPRVESAVADVIDQPECGALRGESGHGPIKALRWEEVVRVETEIYSVASNQLLWAGATKTFEATDATEIVASVSKSVADEMRKGNVRD